MINIERERATTDGERNKRGKLWFKKLSFVLEIR
jgi:hypothetical protein